MTVSAKPMLQDKFWIVQDGGIRVGTLSKDDDKFILNEKGNVSFFENEEQLTKKFGINFLTAKITPSGDSDNLMVHDYPTKTKPFNIMYDISRKLPLFTKSEKSTTLFCAGYYLIRFNVNWLKGFCPKLVTIEENEYLGPFKNEEEMKEALSNVNRAT